MSDTKTDASDIVFTVRLSKADWAPDIRAWRCPALGIPKSKVSALYDGGKRVDEDNYEADEKMRVVRWRTDNPPSIVTAQIQIGGQLYTSGWRTLQGVLAIISTLSAILIALINKGPEYLPLFKLPVETAELNGATFHNWGIEDDRKHVAFNLVVEPFDAAKYVKKSNVDKYRLVFALRPRTSAEDLSGEYDYAKDYSLQNTDRRLIALSNDKLLETAANGCMSLVLFRVSSERLATLPLKTPFAPANYGSDIKVLQSEADGHC
ncbi:hypothetical protein ACVWWO_006453 [Bradyrhizobium sp. F1.13.1]